MRFKVPRNIEHEAKVVGPATFQQILPIGGASFIIFILYLLLREKSMFLFFFLSTIVASGGFALSFLKINQMPLSQYIKNYISFSLAPREYIWKKKEKTINISTERKATVVKEKIEKEEENKPRKESQINRISSKIDSL